MSPIGLGCTSTLIGDIAMNSAHNGNVRHLTPKDLAERWGVTVGHLANLRTDGEGAPYLKLGASVRYPLASIEEYEAARLVQAVAA